MGNRVLICIVKVKGDNSKCVVAVLSAVHTPTHSAFQLHSFNLLSRFGEKHSMLTMKMLTLTCPQTHVLT